MSDARLILARPDLADAALQGKVKAERFEKTTAFHCAAGATAIRRSPDPAAEQVDQLLLGETFRVIETGRGWGWARRAATAMWAMCCWLTCSPAPSLPPTA